MEPFYGNLTPFTIIESFAFGMLIATSLYFFSKNIGGSVLISAPISALYLFFIHQYSMSFVFMFIELLMQFGLVMMVKGIIKQKF